MLLTFIVCPVVPGVLWCGVDFSRELKAERKREELDLAKLQKRLKANREGANSADEELKAYLEYFYEGQDRGR